MYHFFHSLLYRAAGRQRAFVSSQGEKHDVAGHVDLSDGTNIISTIIDF